jgi:hypothetical protein
MVPTTYPTYQVLLNPPWTSFDFCFDFAKKFMKIIYFCLETQWTFFHGQEASLHRGAPGAQEPGRRLQYTYIVTINATVL